jgi:hypothetical protein
MRWIVVAFVLISVAASAGAAEPGNLWQIETSMEMPGMKMPAQSQQVCAPVSAEGPEAMAGEDSECEMTNIRRTPGKFSYDVRCPQGSGTGEMIYEGQDRYTSRMTMTAEGRTMTMVTRGQKVGACDAGAVKKQVEAAQAQAAAGMEQACASMVETMMPANLETYQCAPRYKQKLCRKLETKAGFAEVAPRQPMGNPALDSATLPEVARFCGVDAEGLRARLCGEANRSEDLEFLGSSCPAEAQVIAQRECAGRSFTTPPAARYRDFCGQYARAMMQGGSEEETTSSPDATGEAAGEAVREGAKRLKGMLGF